jgi:hypothetical protein
MRMGDAEAEGLAVRCTEAASRLVTVAVMMRVSDDARNRDRRQRGQDREKSKQSGLLHDGRVLPMMRDGEMREKERDRERGCGTMTMRRDKGKTGVDGKEGSRC